MRLMLLLCLSLCTFTILASEEKYPFDDPNQEQLFLELTQELRCPMCQNQNIADSDAMIAVDLRRKVYQLLQQGYSREEVISFMRDRYGDFISYNPPVTPVTLWLWLLPLVFIFSVLGFVIVRRRSQPQQLDEARLAQADKLLEKDE